MVRRVLQRLGDTMGLESGCSRQDGERQQLGREVRGKWTGRFHMGGNIGESKIKEK